MIVANSQRLNLLRFMLKDLFFKNYSKVNKKSKGFTKCFNEKKKLVFFPALFHLSFLGFIKSSNAEPLETVISEAVVLEQQQGKAKLTPNQISALIKQCDEYFLVGKFQDSYSVLADLKDSKNPEILWRLCRALYNMTKEKGVQKTEIAKMILEAYDYVEEALSLDDKNYAVHKWMAIVVDAKSNLEGIKKRISTLPLFKKHLAEAMKINPQDATSIYLLGQYCYNIADMSWIQRKIASTLFATPPEATFEEALEYFVKAEEAEPNFYSWNLLMLGKTYLKLNQVKPARYWLKCASTYPVRTDEDEEVRKEAEALLRKWKDEKPKQG